MTTTAHTPGPDSETTQLAAGLTAEQAQDHGAREPEPAVGPACEPEPEPGETPEKIPALVISDLRPYADPKAAVSLARRGLAASRKPATRLGHHALAGVAAVAGCFWRGTRILARLLIGWLRGTYGEKFSIPARCGGVVLVLLATVHTVQRYGTPVVLAVVWLWFQAAVMTGRGLFDRKLSKAKAEQPKAAPKAPEKAPEKGQEKAPTSRRKGPARWLRRPAEQTPAEAVEQAPDEDRSEALAEPALTALIRELIGDDNGVHLGVLRPAMRERIPGLAEADDKQLRKVLVEAGFDPSRTFRARGVAGRSGVHRRDLPPLPSPGGAQEDPPGHSPLAESGADLRKSPKVESGRRALRKLPEGWTEEDDARGYRWKNDPGRGPSAWVMERREDVE
ncbi:hypothetical protein [Streptomyces canus]|uniref:hypothetical protein n=1 Tax=Streptomyces canus TaxID=58343 RepID=UPI002780651A|nr:hypothetical protein [Streptomyces canus]MDQ0762045.1 hypothetical protein [Streptomyces canus]